MPQLEKVFRDNCKKTLAKSGDRTIIPRRLGTPVQASLISNKYS